MQVTIRADHVRMIARAIHAGGYESAEDVVGRALEVLRAEDDWLGGTRSSIDSKLELAFAQFERGDFLSDVQSREDMASRKSAWILGQRD
jgi:Arc/MetJ-type ribon-helix-helix transcriptional regulator